MVKEKQMRALKTVKFVLFGFFLAIMLWHFSQSKTVSLQYLDSQGSVHTLTLPLKDKEKLAALMQMLFARDNFAYTILGNKPVSWATYKNPYPFSSWKNFYSSFSDYHLILRDGWNTWKKYSHLFPSSTLLWAESSKFHPDSTSILIVNVEQLNAIVNNYKKDFEEVLQRKVIDGRQLLEEAKSGTFIHDVLKGHQALIGIVLGYGRDNSWKFLEEGCKNRKPIGWVWGEEDFSFPDKIPDEMSLTEFHLSHYSCPSFAGDPNSKESLALKADYLSTKQKVMEYYKGKDFLEATLSLLAGHYSESKR